MKTIKKAYGTLVCQFLFFLPVLFFMSVCSSCGSGNNTKSDSFFDSNPKHARNCQEEYNQLATKTFYDLQKARSAAIDFLSAFNNEEGCTECCDKVRQIESEFVDMAKLFSNVDNSAPTDRYCAYLRMVKSNEGKFSNSSFETVRNTWKYLTDNKSDSYLRERLDLINSDEFKPYLIDYAKQLAEEWYGGGGPTGWVVKDWYILNNEMGNVVKVEDKAAKRCSCTVHVNMEGAMGLGLRSGSVEIWVEGTLGIAASSCNVFFSKGGYNKTKVEGGLKRRG